MTRMDQITEFLQGVMDEVVPVVRVDRAIIGPCSLENPSRDRICFFTKKRWTSAQVDTRSVGMVISSLDFDADLLDNLTAQCRDSGTGLILVRKPRAAFIAVTEAFFVPKPVPGIHPAALIDPAAVIDPTATIAAGAIIGPGVRIGAHSVIAEYVVIAAAAQIGARCYVAPGAKIGQRGFGYERLETGEMAHFPHVGSVSIADDVEIGANTCIDRGTIDDTIIRRGAKIDNLCHIAHNVDIGEDCVVIANSMIGGSVKIGARSWIAPSVSVINGISLGQDVVAGLAATIVKPVPDGQTVAGAPAVEMSQFIRSRRILSKIVATHQEE